MIIFHLIAIACLFIPALASAESLNRPNQAVEGKATFQDKTGHIAKPTEHTIPLRSAATSGQNSCEATNDNGGRCSISCPVGQEASCQDTPGGKTPICECR